MKVTFVCAAADESGGFRVIVTYARLLRERGHDVLIVAPPRQKQSLRGLYRAFRRGESLKFGRRPTHLDSERIPFHILDRPRPVEAADVPAADIVIGTWWETMQWVQQLPSAKGVHVHLVQDYEIWYGNEDAVDRVFAMPDPKIAISGWLGTLLEQKFNQRNVVVLSNAVDHDLFHAPPRAKNKTLTVGFAHSFEHRKGSDIAIAAVRRAKDAIPDLRVLAFGHRAPEKLSALPDFVEFDASPPQGRLREIYAGCDLWLFPTRTEGFGLPILEAMACRTPVVGTPAGAAPELLADGRGMMVAQEDAGGMAAAIAAVGRMSEQEWSALSDKAHAFATTQTWDAVGDRLEQALLEFSRKR